MEVTKLTIGTCFNLNAFEQKINWRGYSPGSGSGKLVWSFIFCLAISTSAISQRMSANVLIADHSVKSGQQTSHKALYQIKHLPGINFAVEKSAAATFVAGERIELSVGFRAEAGSYFSAEIEQHNKAEISAPTAADASDLKVSVFPNPSAGFVHVFAPTTIGSIRLINTFGHVVLQKTPLNTKSTEIDISDLGRGYYIMDVVLESGRGKIRIEKIN